MRSFPRCLLFFVFVSAICFAQTTQADLDAYAAATLKTFQVPGIAVAIVKDGHVVLAKGYGVKKLGDPAPVTENTLFGIGSNTKAFTAAALATLVDEGKLSWDDKVYEKLPGFAMYDPYVSHELTVRDLLCHRSGLGLGEGDMLLWPRTTYTRTEIVQRIRYLKPASSFRSTYAYSNLMFITAGELIAAVSGHRYEEFVRERIFVPLRMTRTNFNHAELKDGADFAWPHSVVENKVTVDDLEDKEAYAAAGGINSSVADLAKWMIVQLNQGQLPDSKQRVFSEKQSQEMWSPQTIVPTPQDSGPLAGLNTYFSAYGLGWGLREYHGHKIVGHSGGLMGFLTRIFMVPDEHLGVVVLTNTDASDGPMMAIAYKVLDDYLGVKGNDWIAAWKAADDKEHHEADEKMQHATTSRDANSHPSLPLEKYAGSYEDAWYGPATVSFQDGKLSFSLDRSPGAVGDLTPWQQDTFKLHWKLEDAFLTFALKPDGRVDHFTMKAVSPLADFSFDYQDFYFTPQNSGKFLISTRGLGLPILDNACIKFLNYIKQITALIHANIWYERASAITEMPESNQIGRREREILTAIVETYLSTGEPVGSRTLARSSREGLSAATIRNVMADLSDAGLLEQPHTSAGRIPTPSAYRYYVKNLTGEATLGPAEEGLIKDTFHNVSDMQEFMERTSHVLSLLSQNVGVAVAGSGPKNALEHVHFQRLAEFKVLAVVVTKSGIVRDRLMRVAVDLPQLELDQAARYINENFRGWTMDDIRAEIARRIEQERSEYDRLMRSVEELYKQGALASEQQPDVYIEGASNLIVGEHDRERLRELLKTLEEKQRIVNLLSAYVDVRQEAVRVVVGLEDTLPHLSNFVLIGAPARVGNEVMGSLAVIGPTRIDYEHTISAVSYIARLFDHIWNDSE